MKSDVFAGQRRKVNRIRKLSGVKLTVRSTEGARQLSRSGADREECGFRGGDGMILGPEFKV